MFLVLFIASIAFAVFIPGMMKRAHVRQQNHLLERCRVLYLLAVRALELGDETAARSFLARIKRMESRWRYGNNIVFRIAFALWAVCVGVWGYLWLRALSFLTVEVHVPTAEDLRRFAEALPVVLAFGVVGALHALSSYFSAWTDWRLVDDCGDRLHRILNAGRHIAVISEDVPRLDGLTPRQIFGLGVTFTRRELDRARRRIAAKLHPDRWYSAHVSVRRAREEALKGVNAAYDRLRPLAT